MDNVRVTKLISGYWGVAGEKAVPGARQPISHFLHHDGSWRLHLSNEAGVMTGVYLTESAAIEVRNRYVPPPKEQLLMEALDKWGEGGYNRDWQKIVDDLRLQGITVRW